MSRLVEENIRAFVNHQQTNWDELLPVWQLARNISRIPQGKPKKKYPQHLKVEPEPRSPRLHPSSTRVRENLVLCKKKVLRDSFQVGATTNPRAKRWAIKSEITSSKVLQLSSEDSAWKSWKSRNLHLYAEVPEWRTVLVTSSKISPKILDSNTPSLRRIYIICVKKASSRFNEDRWTSSLCIFGPEIQGNLPRRVHRKPEIGEHYQRLREHQAERFENVTSTMWDLSRWLFRVRPLTSINR